MDAGTVTRPASSAPPGDGGTLGSASREARVARRRATPRRRRRADLYRPALVLVLLGTFALRLWGIRQGLPYSYNVDEATHFVPRAVAFFSHGLNPQYFLNPPFYSYVVHAVLELWFGSADAVTRAYATDPSQVFLVARLVAAVMGTVAVWLTYLAGARLLGRMVGLVAATVFGVAFLPIFYSHLALNDTPTLAPVALSLYGIAGVLRRGRGRDYAIAGVGVGLAAATKYTGGVTALCLVAAAVCDAAGSSTWPAVRRLAVAAVLALVAFVLANPYSILDFSQFSAGVTSQASLAAGQDPVKLGTTVGSGALYYLWTFTWGLGWGPALAALGGAILLVVRRRLALALVLLPAPIAFILFMGAEQRFFGRWLMPLFPIVVLLAGYGSVELVRWLVRARGVPRLAAGTVVLVILVSQSLVAVVHDDLVLSRPDTRNLTRAWMVSHVPAGAKVVIEPVVPDTWATDVGAALPWTPTGERWWRYPTWVTDIDVHGDPLPPGQKRLVAVDQYERTLRPALLDEYARAGFCWLVIGSLQAGRAFAAPQAAPEAVAYYTALASRARLVFHVSPFARRSHPVPFSFDWSIDYYPVQYRRPGPEMSVYRLTGGRCGAS